MKPCNGCTTAEICHVTNNCQLHAETEASDLLTCSVPLDLLEALLDNTYELRGERHWWKDEPRCNYQRDYGRYCEEIKLAEKILER